MTVTNKTANSTNVCGLRITVDHDQCIGIGSCEVIAAGLFRLNGERVAELIGDAEVSREEVLEAAMECPVEAISVETEEGEIVWPPY
ncbi:MAG: ferredoxin [Thermomicrobiales bacterium]